MSCPRVETCPMYAQFKVKPLLEVWKSFYCEADYKQCVRFQMVGRGETPDVNLLPNGDRMNVPTSRT